MQNPSVLNCISGLTYFWLAKKNHNIICIDIDIIHAMYFLLNRILLYLKGTIDQYCFLINWGHRGKGQDRLFVWVISFSDVWKLKSMVRDQYGLRSKPRKNAVVLSPDLQCWSSCCINCPLSFFCLATFPLSFFCLPTFILRLFNMASQNCHAIASMGLFPFHVYLATSWHSNCQAVFATKLTSQPHNYDSNSYALLWVKFKILW